MKGQEFSEQSLADLSVRTIARNFERFMAAYRSSNSAIPPRHFEFLQRTQSKPLLQKLFYSQDVSLIDQVRENLDFLVNRHLKEIEFDLFLQNNIPRIAERIKVIGDTITMLNLSGEEYHAENTLLEITSYMPNVQSMSLYGYVTEHVLQNIGERCSALEILNVSYCQCVEDKGIQALCRVTNNDSDRNSNTDEVCQNFTLKHLDIESTCVTEFGIAFILKYFPNMTVIKHKDVLCALANIHFEDFQNNRLSCYTTYNLKELQTSYNPGGGDLLKMCNVVCPDLTKLEIFLDGPVQAAEVHALLQFTKLKQLKYWGFLSFYSFTPFIKACGKNLESLTLTYASISIELLLKFCEKLKRLHLQNIRFEPTEEIQPISLGHTFQHLKDLSIEGICFANVVVKSVKLILSSSPNLQKVSFAKTKTFTLDFVNSLSVFMKNVRDLDVSHSDIKFPAAKALLLSTPKLMCYRCWELSHKDYDTLSKLRPSVRFIWCEDVSMYRNPGVSSYL